MATGNASVAFAYSSNAQPLYTITETDEGTMQYNSIGNVVPLIFTDIVTGVGSDISIDTETGEITLQGSGSGITYTLTTLVNPGDQVNSSSALNGAIIQVWDEAGPYPQGITGTLGETLFTTITCTSETVVQVLLTGANGNIFRYPDQVYNASINVQAVNGYTT